MDSFIMKIVLTSILISVATLASRRWGETVAGWIIGLPLKSGPTSVFFAIEQGPAFAADAARATLLGLTATAAFFIGYTVGAQKVPGGGKHKGIPLVTGILTYFLAVMGLSSLAPNLATSAVMVTIVLTFALWLLGDPEARGERLPPPWWDLPLRVVSAVTLVLVLTGAAQRLGPRWSGLLSPFPIFTCVMTTFAYSQGGPTGALRLIRGAATGLFAFTAFFVIVALLVNTTSLPVAYGVATITALGINWLTLNLVIRKKALPQPAEEGETI